MLAQDLHPDRALARDDVRVVIGVHEHGARRLLQLERVRVRVAVGVPAQHHFRAARLDRPDLDVRRRDGHHDGGVAAELLRGERYPLRMVAGRGCDDAARPLRRGEVRHLVVGAAQLEREDALLVLALQQHAVAEPARQRRCVLERRLDGDVVDPGGEDLLQIVDGHRAASPSRRNDGA
jgi:hypothetical protein